MFGFPGIVPQAARPGLGERLRLATLFGPAGLLLGLLTQAHLASGAGLNATAIVLAALHLPCLTMALRAMVLRFARPDLNLSVLYLLKGYALSTAAVLAVLP